MRAILRVFLLLILISSIAVGSKAASEPLKNMTEVATFTTHDPHDAVFHENYLFVADGNSLMVYNTSDPERPKSINIFTDINEPGRVYGLSISGEQLYIAAGPGWIYVLNISDPEKPKRMYQINYLNSANSVAVTDEYMYVADANTGLLIFNLTDRRNPGLVGRFYVLKSNVSGTFQGWGGISVEVSGKYVFLSGEQRKGFYIIDVSDPAAPKEVYHSVGKNVYDIALSENYAYLARADGTSQFDVLDISNPYAPTNSGNFSIIETAERSAIAVHPSGYYLYAASGDSWHIFRIPDNIPPQIIIEKPEPNEIFTDQTINVSGRASDRSGIMEVLVNGKFAGTESWNQIITLVEGTNDITITALDRNGNSLTERLQVTYSPSVTPAITTPVQTVNATTPIQNGAERVDITKSPVFYSLVFVVFIVLISIVLIYWVWLHKMKR